MQTWKRVISLLLCVTMVLSCVPNVWAADAGTTAYVKVTSEAEFTSGNYVMVTSTGYAPGVFSGGWLTAVQPTISGDEVVDTAGAVWKLEVDGSAVRLIDANGAIAKPKGGNNNGIATGDYSWSWVFADGCFQFNGVGSDTVILASNKGSANQFRAYKSATVSGNPSGYPSTFTLYKEVALSGGDVEVPVETMPVATEPAIRETEITVSADKTQLHPGDEFTVTVSISGDVPFTSVGYVPEQASVYFEILSGAVLSGGEFATMANYQVGSGGVIYFENAATVNDAIFSVTMKVRDDAPVGAFEVTAKEEGVQVRNVDDYVPFTLNEPTFTVSVPELPDGTELTIAQALEIASAKEHNVYTSNKYKVTGVITEVYNTTYGNMRITDGNGNILTIYGTYSADGSTRYDAMEVKPVAGDTVTIYGIVGQYNGTAQIKNGWIVGHIPGEPQPTEPEVTEPVVSEELTVEQAIALGAAQEHNVYTTEKYKVTGVITEVYNTTYGNMKITDGNGNILTIYGSYSADGSTRYDAMEVKPVAGDTVTVYGVLGQYNGTPQIKNGWIVGHIPGEPQPTEPVVTEPTVAPTEPEATEPVVTEPAEPGTSYAVLDLSYQTNRVSYATDSVTYRGNGITFINEKAASTSDMRDSADDDHIRLYKSSLVRISYPNMTKLVFTATTASYATAAAESMKSLGAVTVDGKIVTLDLATVADTIEYTATAQHRFSQVAIYADDSIDPTAVPTEPVVTEPVEPTVAPTEPVVTEPVEPTVAPTEPAGIVGYCPHCDQDVQWTPWAGEKLLSGHYCLTDDLTLEKVSLVGSSGGLEDAILNLNGYTLSGENRVFSLNYGSVLTLLDTSADGSGQVIGNLTSGTGGIAQISNGTLTILSGNYSLAESAVVTSGGLFMVSMETGVLNIYGGKFNGGVVAGSGGILSVSKGVANIYGGSFIPGTAKNGDSIYVASGGTVNIIGAPYIGGGVAAVSTANLYIGGSPVIQASGNTSYGVKLLNGALITVGQLEEGASIGVTANGVFTNSFPSVDDAAMASWHFTCDDPSKVIMTSSNGLQVSDPVVGPTMPSEPVATEPTVVPTEPIATEPTVAPTEPSEPAVRVAYCPHCDQTVEWTPWDGYKPTTDCHIYLAQDMEMYSTIIIGVDGANSDVVLDLNGHTITSKSRTFTVSFNAQFSVLDSVGGGAVYSMAGGTGGMFQTSKGSINIYSGTYELISSGNVKNGGLFYITGTTSNLNIYGGTFIGNAITGNGGIMQIAGATANILGGMFIPGKATNQGDSIYISGAAANVTIGGSAYIEGGVEVYTGKLTLTGSPVIIAKGSQYGLKVKNTTIAIGELTEDAKISVTADGIFTDEFASVDEAAAVMWRFYSDDPSKTIITQSNALAMVDIVTEPTDPSEPPATEPTEPEPSEPEATEPPVIVEADAIVYVIPEQAEVQQGGTVTFLVKVESKKPISSIGYIHKMDESLFQVISGEVLTSGALKEYTANDGGVVAFSSANIFSGDVFRVTVQINENAPLGYMSFTQEVAIKNSAQQLSVALVETAVKVVCKDHEFSDWTAYSDYEHQRYCSKCDTTERISHEWNEGVVTIQPTCAKYGEMSYTCSVCNYTKYETLYPTYDHVYGEWMEYSYGEHRRVCTGEDCWAEEFESHYWDEGVVTIAPTCYQYGQMTYTCQTCGFTRFEDIMPTYEHVYGEWYNQYDGTHTRYCLTDGCWSYECYGHNWDGGVETQAPTCIHFGIMTYTCVDCGAQQTQDIWPTYVHTYDNYEYVDMYNHKRVCTVEGCYAEEWWSHNWDGGTVTQQPTCVAYGTIVYKCHDCAGVRSESLWPTYSHIYTEKTPVDNYLHVWGCETCSQTWEGDHFLEEGTCHQCGFVRTYTVTFRDEDGTVISENTYHYGDVVAVPENPFKAADGEYVYEFAGWNREILTQCVGSATYTAQYNIVAVRADFDADGTVTDADAYYLLRNILFPEEYPIRQNGDLNGDGVETDADAMYLLRYVLFGAERYPLTHEIVKG